MVDRCKRGDVLEHTAKWIRARIVRRPREDLPKDGIQTFWPSGCVMVTPSHMSIPFEISASLRGTVELHLDSADWLRIAGEKIRFARVCPSL